MSELLEAALHACGDPARWDRLTTVRLQLRVRGNLLMSKCKSPRVRPYTVELSTRRVRAVLFPFGRHKGRGILEGDSVRLESASGQRLAERDGARAHAREHLVWDDLDLMYFLGYAFWNYLNTPFLFRWEGFRAVEIDPWTGPRSALGPESRSLRPLRRLLVHFPPEIPTHCPEQVFYFDEQAQLCRLDYTAEIFSRHLRGAHLCLAHRKWDCGFVTATHRRVVPFLGDLRPLLWAPAAMEGWLDDVQVQ